MADTMTKFWNNYLSQNTLEQNKIIKENFYPRFKEIFSLKQGKKVEEHLFCMLFKSYLNDLIEILDKKR
jgi:hypothetical protein